jgi:serpin B
MLRRTLPWLVLLSSLGCGSDPTPPPGDELRSNESRLAASTDLGAVRTLAANDAAFAMALHAELPRDENLFYSPHGISIALAMTYAGAAGDTAQEMRDTLRFAQEPAVLHQAFNTLDQLLESRGEGQLGADGSPFRLRIVDAIFAQRGFPIHDRYLDDMARWYGAGLHVLDFATQTESSRAAINAWIADATEDRI